MDFSAGAIVYNIQDNQPRYLLVLAANKEYWGFPKGHSEKNETPEQTIVREVCEETGNRIIINPDFTHEMRYNLPSGEEKVVALKVAQSIQEDLVTLPNNEIAEIKWCTFDEAIKLMKYEDTVQALQKAHEFIMK